MVHPRQLLSVLSCCTFLIGGVVGVVSLVSFPAQAEDFQLPPQTQTIWTNERLAWEIDRAERGILLKERRLDQMREELARRLSDVESAAGGETYDEGAKVKASDHFLGHH